MVVVVLKVSVNGSSGMSPGMLWSDVDWCSSGSKPGGGAGGAPTVSVKTGGCVGLEGARPSEFQKRTQLQLDADRQKDVNGHTT